MLLPVRLIDLFPGCTNAALHKRAGNAGGHGFIVQERQISASAIVSARLATLYVDNVK